MRRTLPNPSLVPEYGVAVHIVLDGLGKSGRIYRETDEIQADFETVVTDILTGQYNDPVRIIAFNTAEGWARDVTEDVAREVLARAYRDDLTLRGAIRDFVERETAATFADWFGERAKRSACDLEAGLRASDARKRPGKQLSAS